MRGSGGEVEHALQRRADSYQFDLPVVQIEFIEDSQKTAGAGAVEEHHRFEIDSEAGVSLEMGNRCHKRRFSAGGFAVWRTVNSLIEIS